MLGRRGIFKALFGVAASTAIPKEAFAALMDEPGPVVGMSVGSHGDRAVTYDPFTHTIRLNDGRIVIPSNVKKVMRFDSRDFGVVKITKPEPVDVTREYLGWLKAAANAYHAYRVPTEAEPAPAATPAAMIRKCRNCGFERETHQEGVDLPPDRCGRCR